MTCLYLLVKILAHIPTKDVVATSLLFKRWEFLWTYMKRLEYDQEYQFGKRIGFSRFVDKEIGLWIRTAVRRGIPELTLECGDILIQLPLRLLTCKTLVILDLKGWIDLNIPVTASLPSLMTLHIVLLRKSNYEHFSRILSSFSLLVDLMVEQRTSTAISTLDIAVPSLQRLFIRTVTKKDNGLRYSPHEKPIPKVMINAPCLKYLNIDDRGNDFNVIKDLTQVVEATINAKQTSTKVFLMYLTSSIKRLLLYSLRLEDMDPSIFCKLVNLELCTSTCGWLKLLANSRLKLFNVM
ncbi:hypothetical protein BRARA_J01071 [Brassica rapa]|uniref:F-box domain-containing protein n=1 Tax=Brassica campestris TaxID=3711 RepID=A0A397XNF0_BRACM|nr:hypothetical protein BRARA_J01071 [Brassica rapa]